MIKRLNARQLRHPCRRFMAIEAAMWLIVVVAMMSQASAQAEWLLNPQGAVETKENQDQPDALNDTSLDVLRAYQVVFADVANKLAPSLVRIETVGGSQPQDQPDPESTAPAEGKRPTRRKQNPFRDGPGSSFALADGATTGVIWSADGYIVTSSFNFVREPRLIQVTLSDGRRLAATLVARDQVRKVALLKVEATDLAPPAWADVTTVQTGQSVISLGVGFGGNQPSMTVGIISALRRMRGYCVQTDAKLSPANYGGPLVDRQGKVIGLCVPMAQRAGELAGVELYDSGIGFALRADKLQEIVPQLKEGKNVYRGWLGMVTSPAVQDKVLVLQVADPSPMHQAGIRPGDTLLEIAGEAIRHFGDLQRAVAMKAAGETVSIRYQRGQQELQADVVLARAEELGDLIEVSEPFDPSQPFEEEGQLPRELPMPEIPSP